jgi:chromosome segregation ATPase
VTEEPTRIEQLSAVLKDLAAASERQSAQLTELVARVDGLESRLAATQSAQSQTAERVERLASDSDVKQAMDAVSEQLTALRGAQTQASGRIETLASDLARISRLDAAIGHLRDEMSAKTEGAAASLLAEIDATRKAQARDASELGRQVRALQQDSEHLRQWSEKLVAVEHHQTESDSQTARLTTRVDQMAQWRPEFAEALARLELHLGSRVNGLVQQLTVLEGEFADWRNRIDQQSEAVREARSVAAGMQAEAERMATAHHAIAETQRIHEARIQASLADLRADLTGAWQESKQVVDRQWSSLADANAARDRASAALEAAVVAVDSRVDDLLQDTRRELEALAAAGHKLRADLAGALVAWRAGIDETIGAVEADLPQGKQSANAAERREALRLALKARRDEPET